MATRIIVNGEEYESVDAMPAEVRRAYQQALAQLTDDDGNGIPDIVERDAGKDVVAIQNSSITINGRTFTDVEKLPAPVRWLYEQAMNQVDANRNGIPDAVEPTAKESPKESPPPFRSDGAFRKGVIYERDDSADMSDRDRFLKGLDRVDRTLTTFLQLFLGVAAVGILAGAVFLMTKMDGGSRSQGGRFYVVVGALFALGAVASQFGGTVKRKAPFSLTPTPQERRFYLISLLLLLASAAVLIGLAWLLP